MTRTPDWSGRLVHVQNEDVPEGIFFPEREDRMEHERQATAFAARSWRATGGRTVALARKFGPQTIHALRTAPRGYGKRRRLWQQTTECGQITDAGWAAWPDRLDLTTCLTCRRVVRERHEQDDTYGLTGAADALLDEYDDQQEPWWDPQRRRHEADE